jgi:hypothetical protein
VTSYDLTGACDWLVLATLVLGSVAVRFDSRPYVSELQDLLVVVSVRFTSFKSFALLKNCERKGF